jgi:hypothetical protein
MPALSPARRRLGALAVALCSTPRSAINRDPHGTQSSGPPAPAPQCPRGAALPVSRGQAAVLHGDIRGGQIVRRGVRRARTDAHRGVQVRVGRSQDHAHGRALRYPGDEDPARIAIIGCYCSAYGLARLWPQ